MKESVHIVNRFSDAYLVAMIEGGSTADIIRTQEIDFPELSVTFREEARRLELLYGYLRTSKAPLEAEIAAAYRNVQSRVTPVPEVVMPQRMPAFSLRQAISSFFAARPITAGASLAVIVTAIIAMIIFPWSQSEKPGGTAQSEQGITAPRLRGTAPGEIAEGEKPNPSDQIAPSPAFRGGNATGGQDKDKIDKKDRERLAKLQSVNTIAAPAGLKIVSQSGDTLVLQWNKVPNALSYIVELKAANAATFKAVTQTSQTQARLPGISTGHVELRVIAASGERKGEPSAVVTASIP